jgi:hypothetical protein
MRVRNLASCLLFLASFLEAACSQEEALLTDAAEPDGGTAAPAGGNLINGQAGGATGNGAAGAASGLVGTGGVAMSPAAPTPLATAANCPTYSDSAELARACMFDSNGKTYAVTGTMYAFPETPPYGAIFVFQPGWAPLPEDVTSDGPGAGIGVFAAAYDVGSGTQCCAEDNEANRIVATTALDENGVLTISVASAVPVGYQIAIILNYGGLYRHRLVPEAGEACNLPSKEVCKYAESTGFAMRFYVGVTPASVAPRVPLDPSAVPEGACLLEYNSALASGDACCYRKGGANTCDVNVQCNERSGQGCCLVYGTENTSFGQRCCLYAERRNVDGAGECDQLLAAK